jgi:hypothetical protein
MTDHPHLRVGRHRGRGCDRMQARLEGVTCQQRRRGGRGWRGAEGVGEVEAGGQVRTAIKRKRKVVRRKMIGGRAIGRFHF